MWFKIWSTLRDIFAGLDTCLSSPNYPDRKSSASNTRDKIARRFGLGVGHADEKEERETKRIISQSSSITFIHKLTQARGSLETIRDSRNK